MGQAEEGIRATAEICSGDMLEQDATGSAPWENPSGCSRGLGNSTTIAHLLLSWHCQSTVCFFSQQRVPGAGLKTDESKQNLGRTLAPAENALPEH